MRIHCNTCGWNGEGEHIIEPGDCHRIDYVQDRPTPDNEDDGSGVK